MFINEWSQPKVFVGEEDAGYIGIGVDWRGMSEAQLNVAGWKITLVEALRLLGYKRQDSALQRIEPSEVSFRM